MGQNPFCDAISCSSAQDMPISQNPNIHTILQDMIFTIQCQMNQTHNLTCYIFNIYFTSSSSTPPIGPALNISAS